MPAYYNPDNGSFKSPDGKGRLRWRCKKCATINSLEVHYCTKCNTRIGADDSEDLPKRDPVPVGGDEDS